MRITDPQFVYVRAEDTDIRKTFARVRARMGKESSSKPAPVASVYLPLLPAQRAVQRMLDEQERSRA